MESNRKRRGFMKGKLMPFYRSPKSSSNLQYSNKVIKPSQPPPSAASVGYLIHHQDYLITPPKQQKVSFIVPAAEDKLTQLDKIYGVTVDESVDIKAASYISSVQERFKLERSSSERLKLEDLNLLSKPAEETFLLLQMIYALHKWGNFESLKKTFERYHAHKSKQAKVNNRTAPKKHQAGGEALPTATIQLEMLQRHLEEESLKKLNTTQLIQLQEQMVSMLRLTKLRKTQLMMETLPNVHQKEKKLEEENSVLGEEIPLTTAILNDQNQSNLQNHDDLNQPQGIINFF